MQQKKTTKEEYQKCVNVVVEYINQHLGEDIDLKSLARISNFSPKIQIKSYQVKKKKF